MENVMTFLFTLLLAGGMAFSSADKGKKIDTQSMTYSTTTTTDGGGTSGGGTEEETPPWMNGGSDK